MFMLRDINLKQDSGTLEMNMEKIVNELSELVVDTTPVAVPNFWMPKVQNEGNARNAHLNGANVVPVDKELMLPIQDNTYFSNAHEPPFPLTSFCNNEVMGPQVPSAFLGRQLNIVQPLYNSFTEISAEIGKTGHYTRLVNSADVGQHQALLCASVDERTPEELYACPHFKRRNRKKCGKFSRTKPKAPIDYDAVVIDLSAIGLNTDNFETNDVLRLFGLFRKLNYYINDVIPFEAEQDVSDYPSVFVKPTALVPCTMNVQSQIKHVLHRLNGFSCRLYKELDEFKLTDRDQFIQCSHSLYVLRKATKQLEPFKTAEFEHKQGVFVNSFGAAQAKNLEILLGQLIGKTRECNVSIAKFLWRAKKHTQRTGLVSMETLKKAIAIAGASQQNESPTSTLEPEAEVETSISPTNEETNEISSLKGNDGNDGGAVSLGNSPTPFRNRRTLRFIGA